MLEIMNQAINLVEDEGDDLGDETRDIVDRFRERANDRHQTTINTSGFPAFDSPSTDDDGHEEMGGT